MDIAAVTSGSTHIAVGTLLYITCVSEGTIDYAISGCPCYTVRVREAHVSFMERQQDRYLVLLTDKQAKKLDTVCSPAIVEVKSCADFEVNVHNRFV